MGFLFGSSEDLLPKVLMSTLVILGSIRTFILTLIRFLGLMPHFLEPDIDWPEPRSEFGSVSASLIRDLLPVMRFRDVKVKSRSGCDDDPPERCTVCLHEFHDQEEIRRLTNCGHIFHKACVDRWIDHDQITCPLCRTPFVPLDLVEAFNELGKCCRDPSTFPEFGGDFSPINVFL